MAFAFRTSLIRSGMAREKFPSDEIDRIMVRFPAGMRDRIAEAAHENKRSMNAEIIARLERSLNGPAIDDPLLTESDLALVRQIHDRSQRTLLDISAQAERITSAVEILLAKDAATSDRAMTSASRQRKEVK